MRIWANVFGGDQSSQIGVTSTQLTGGQWIAAAVRVTSGGQNAYAGLGHGPGSFPHAERASERVLSMPLFPEMTIEQAEYAARALAEIVGAR